MTSTGFGEHLKREREMRGVALEEICAATRIGTRFLLALENEDWEQLPGGVFNRGFVRAVSRYLGLDEEGMVTEYVTAVDEGRATPNWAAQPETTHSSPRRWPWIAALAVVVLVLGAWMAWRVYAARRADAGSARIAAASPASAPSGASPGSAAPGANSAPDASPKTDSPPVAVSGPNGPDAAASGSLVLKIEAGKATSVTVSADGVGAFSGNIIAGQSRTFEAHNEFDVTASDGGALLLELNGQTLAPIGPPGRSGKVTLTRRNLKASVAGGVN